MIDPYTYGDTPAAVNLAKMLNERNNPKITRKISRTIQSFRVFLKEIRDCCLDYEIVKELIIFKYKKLVDVSERWSVEETIRTHCLCIMKTDYLSVFRLIKCRKEYFEMDRTRQCTGMRFSDDWKAGRVKI